MSVFGWAKGRHRVTSGTDKSGNGRAPGSDSVERGRARQTRATGTGHANAKVAPHRGTAVGNNAQSPRAVARSRHRADKAATRGVSTERAPVINRIEDLPAYVEVLSVEGGKLKLSQEAMSDYAIILAEKKASSDAEGRPLTYLIRNIERHADVMELRTMGSKLRKMGYDVIKRDANPGIISIIYERAQRRKSKSARNTTPLEELFDNLLREALQRKASDIHIEIRDESAQVRLRVHGKLRRSRWNGNLAVEKAKQLVSVIYQVIADERDVIFKENSPQDANIDRVLDGQRLRIRFGTIPAYPHGYDAVMRIIPLGQDASGQTLAGLGYSSEQIVLLEHAMARPVGTIILSGTTGSGKSTTLVTLLTKKIREHGGLLKVITVEDPPEWEIPGSTQVPVIRNRAGDGSEEKVFQESIRAAMRCDPDVLMIGEVRDRASADLLKAAVQSGHQALTTVHAGSAFGIIGRLRSNGLDNDVLSSPDFISALVSQSLIPVVCPRCSISYTDFRDKNRDHAGAMGLLSRLDNVIGTTNRGKLRFINPVGCQDNADCDGGVIGRTVVAEIVPYDSDIFKRVAEGKDIEALDLYIKNGGRTIMDHGIEKVMNGLCDPRDVEKALGIIAPTPHMTIYGPGREQDSESSPLRKRG